MAKGKYATRADNRRIAELEAQVAQQCGIIMDRQREIDKLTKVLREERANRAKEVLRRADELNREQFEALTEQLHAQQAKHEALLIEVAEWVADVFRRQGTYLPEGSQYLPPQQMILDFFVKLGVGGSIGLYMNKILGGYGHWHGSRRSRRANAHDIHVFRADNVHPQLATVEKMVDLNDAQHRRMAPELQDKIDQITMGEDEWKQSSERT